MKRFLALALALCLAAPLSLSAQQAGGKLTDTTAIRVSYDSEKIAVSTAAIGFTASKISPTNANRDAATQLKASAATCSVESASIRILTTGTSPTSTTGFLIAAGSSFTIFGSTDIANFKAIRTGGSDAALNCVYAR